MAKKKDSLIGYDVTAVKRPAFDGFNRAGRNFSDATPTFVPVDDRGLQSILDEPQLQCRAVYGEAVEAETEA